MFFTFVTVCKNRLLRPTKQINPPNPALTAYFNDLGIDLIISSLIGVKVIIKNKIPAIKTNIKLCGNVYPIVPQTVKAIKAFTPIPADKATGRFASNPIKIQHNALHIAVAKNTAL